MSFFVTDALAATTASTSTTQSGGGMSSLIMIVAFVAVFYLLLWLPQSRRIKEQKNLINNLAKGDEVITGGGILGRITKISDNFIVLAIADNIEICVQKAAITASVPKGTMKSAM